MPHPKVVTPILPRTNNQPKTKVNRMAEIVRSVRNDFFCDEPPTIASTLREVMEVLNDFHTDTEAHSEDCQLCYAMRLCAAELITLKRHAADTLQQTRGAL
jgi:hypothetical protein